MAALPEATFDAAHNVLRRLSLRTQLQFDGLWRLVGWGFMLGGGFFVCLGLALDAIFYDGLPRLSIVWWVVYALVSVFVFFHTQGPTVVAGTSYHASRWFERTALIGHGLFLLGALLYSGSAQLILILEGGWLVLWTGLLLATMQWSKAPISVGYWLVGCVRLCNGRDMVLDAVRSWAWWDGLSHGDKKILWDALPDWKWELHAHSMEKQDDDLAERIAEWMELEKHPYWHVARIMHPNDIPTSIRVFLEVRDGGAEPEVYELPS